MALRVATPRETNKTMIFQPSVCIARFEAGVRIDETFSAVRQCLLVLKKVIKKKEGGGGGGLSNLLKDRTMSDFL